MLGFIVLGIAALLIYGLYILDSVQDEKLSKRKSSLKRGKRNGLRKK